MRWASLFSGVGGFDLGLERAGIEIAVQVEANRHCRSVLRRHWPESEIIDDVNLPRTDAAVSGIDGICGGFPCQDISLAGKRAGLDGERSGLWFRFRDVIAEAAPRWVLIENVDGLRSSNGGRDLGAILGGLGDLGYGWAYRVFNSQFFGVAQRRRRVFIVGHSGGVRSAAKVLFEPGRLPWDSEASRESGPRPAALTASGAGVSGADLRDACAGHLIPEVAGCLQERDAKGPDSDTKPGHLIPMVPVDYLTGRYDERETSATLTTTEESRNGAVAVVQNYNGKVWEREIMPTLTLPAGRPGLGNPVIRTGARVRRLTPVECERLQGFPDNWTARGAENELIPDSARYRMMGNAVTVNVAEWIGRRIVECDTSSC